MIKVNLLPEQARRKTAKKKRAKVKFEFPLAWILGGLATIIAVCIGLAIVHLSLQKKVKAIESEIAMVESQIASLKIDIGKVDQAKRVKNQLIQKLEVIDSLKRQQSGPVRLLDELAACIPPKLWLQEMTEDGASIQVKGNAMEDTSISQFMNNMNKNAYFTNVELSAAETSGKTKIPGFTSKDAPLLKDFQISAAMVKNADKVQ